MLRQLLKLFGLATVFGRLDAFIIKSWTLSGPSSTGESSKYRPVIFWHGYGDSAHSGGMETIASIIHETFPGIFVYSVELGKNENDDSWASIFGNAKDELEKVYKIIVGMPELESGFDAIGFSQGGFFMRALLEYYDLPMRRLITLGSPHNGISTIPCKGILSSICKNINPSIVYSPLFQQRIIPSTYLKLDDERYLKNSLILADINNERSQKSQLFKQRFTQLEKFHMIRFEKDTTIIPMESEWFAEPEKSFRETEIYLNDWIGLRELDEKGAISFASIPEDHMNFSQEQFRDMVVKPFLGSPKSSIVEMTITRLDESDVQDLTAKS